MVFPVIFHIAGFAVHAHQIFELAGYAVGTQLLIFFGKRMPGPKLDFEQGTLIVLGCLVGALIGSRLLAFVESIHTYWPLLDEPQLFFDGKTIAGGLAGGWAGVEMVKWSLGIRRSTGDRFVFPILIGIAIGRIGCFLEGLPDHTYGIATSLPWGVDFGDGVRRHPTQLYESLFCLLLAGAIWVRMRRPWRCGELFRFCMLGYFAWRFCVEFIKPRETYGGLSPIQMTSLAVVVISIISLRRLRVTEPFPDKETIHA
ncbi:MAG TPA: prolipoprotein diacylglyceryl transferase family protein [Tepidisphaeraceae bacterium]|nr:prolipoprotein diacylglyceryl transferase family protein [Tepidisphaeraceae bacterium]